jgi:hypothetical protein
MSDKNTSLPSTDPNNAPQDETLVAKQVELPTADAKLKKTTMPTKKKPHPPKAEDFGSGQISLFQDLLCNTELERDSLSNVFDLWDGIPRYSISRQQQDKWRKAGTFPQLYDIDFHYRGRELKATIQPAWIKDKEGTIGDIVKSGVWPVWIRRRFSADRPLFLRADRRPRGRL